MTMSSLSSKSLGVHLKSGQKRKYVLIEFNMTLSYNSDIWSRTVKCRYMLFYVFIHLRVIVIKLFSLLNVG